MIIDSLKVRGPSCFRQDFVGFKALRPVNVIIGRNNSGKSQLLDLFASLNGKALPHEWEYECEGVLDEPSLRAVFSPSISEGVLKRNHWTDHGRFFVDRRIGWRVVGGAPQDLHFADFDPKSPFGEPSTQERLRAIGRVLAGAKHRFSGALFCRLSAERDIQPEAAHDAVDLDSHGVGATNVITKYLTTANPSFPRELIQTDLLQALNSIFGSDGQFTEIIVRLHDGQSGGRQGTWEVFLTEEHKGPIALSRSGSGLKTVLLVLLNLIVVPRFKQRKTGECVFTFEELENNLHPAVLRRLLRFIESFMAKEGATAFLTTHAGATLDVFGISEKAQILHVVHDGQWASTVEVSAHFERMNVLTSLGAKPSDLLQANGVIWVEGPSDRVYVNRWIELLTFGRLKEGRDYQCAFYGGALLAKAQFSSPDDSDDNLANLLRVNPNIAVVCDSDRTAGSGEGSALKGRVTRILGEVERIPGAFIWVTEAKEIENYIPGSCLGVVFDQADVPDPQQFEAFFPSKSGEESFVEANLNRKGFDKVDLALRVVPHLTLDAVKARFDLSREVQALIGKIDAWNA